MHENAAMPQIIGGFSHRFFLQWEKNDWNIRIGRQRVNWGIQNFWNPHDLFNQTNFFDFDYIEKPGSDAIRVQYYPNSNQSLEFALNEDIQGGLYRFNKFKYDFQCKFDFSVA